ncbi:transglutaminase domain-containing protein [Flavobacterium ardleyense]|uniref:Transglutaminase domain-containing protein n=1 Tax=Flavobacterium ardleyense TaxID=2038737 RepID=A0ABW5Z7Y8_9FLAO
MKYIIYFLLLPIVAFSQVQNTYLPVEKLMRSIPEKQNKSVQDIAKYIQANFKSEELQIKAAYFYVATNISYDIAHNFSTELLSSDEDFVTKALTSKKGVCIHYAKLFKAIADDLKYPCEIITGYTKQNNQIAKLSHAWCAIKFKDNNWYIFDPTWDSGYVNNGKFTRNLGAKYYKQLPAASLRTHMPFDYLWQFSKEPISNQEFYNGKTFEGKPKMNFNYQKEIDKYLKLSLIDQAFETSERIEKNGILNNLILEEYTFKKNVFSVTQQNTNIKKLNEIVEEYNVAIILLNDFIIYRNKEFTPSYSDGVLLEMIKTPQEQLEKVKKEIFVLGTVGKENAANFISLKASIVDAEKQAQEQAIFVKEYVSKSKKDRKKMFRKSTWFGIPVK